MPKDASVPDFITRRRIATDSVVTALLGMRGDIWKSRDAAKRGIKADPDYPTNYYNLARADAEEDKAADAKIHLQQAFGRKANVISGEKMADPTKDPSIMKLIKDNDFWAFVQTLK